MEFDKSRVSEISTSTLVSPLWEWYSRLVCDDRQALHVRIANLLRNRLRPSQLTANQPPPLIPSAYIKSKQISEDVGLGYDIVSTCPGNTLARFMAYHAATGAILVRGRHPEDFGLV